ncbi:MAG: pilin [Woeseiaceae bacterium]|nr:pilin [Woeseiaceae bacterium]
MRRLIARITAFGLAGFASVAFAQTEVPNEFQAGQPARAAEVNENFDVLEQAVQDLELSSSTVAVQVQSAIDLASEPRWLTTDYYRRFGVWPADNATAGAELPQNYNNIFVTRVDVAFNVVTATFGNDAAAELAGETIVFTFTDNIGAIPFVCSTAAAVESLLPEGYCSYVDSPPVGIQTIRNQISSAIALASEARWHVEDFYRNQGAFPNDNAEAGAPSSTTIRNDVVDNVSVTAGGQVTATFSSNANANIVADTISFIPTDNGGSISWACATLGIETRFVPQLLGGASCIEVPDEAPIPLITIRNQIESAFPAAQRLQAAAEVYYAANGVWPASNAEAGEPAPAQFAGNAFDSIGLLSDRSGTIVVTYGNRANGQIAAATVELVPTDAGANISWQCGSTSIAQRLLPYECRN